MCRSAPEKSRIELEILSLRRIPQKSFYNYGKSGKEKVLIVKDFEPLFMRHCRVLRRFGRRETSKEANFDGRGGDDNVRLLFFVLVSLVNFIKHLPHLGRESPEKVFLISMFRANWALYSKRKDWSTI